MEPPAPTPGKKVTESLTETVELVLPNDANPAGNILGGNVMRQIDLVAAIAAHRHCRSYTVTASMDELVFHNPIKVGDLICLRAWVNATFTTSMEIQVQVCAEDILTGRRRPTSTAFLTFVALDKYGNKIPVPPLLTQAPEEEERAAAAAARRQARLERRRSLAPPPA